MSLWTKVLVYLSNQTAKERVYRAYRLWIASGQQTDAITFITNMTGIPSHKVKGVLLGKRNENG